MCSSSPDTSHSLRPGLRPLVILGAPRSGTKLLRSLLGQSARCTTIPYGINHVWRTGLPPDAPDRRPASDATPKRTQQIRSHLLDLSGISSSFSGYLVEKTCANMLRVPFVARVLPDARFIHILRDGRDAAVSAREKWNRPPSLRYVLGKLRYVPLRNLSFLLWYLRNLWQGLFTEDGSVQYWGPRYGDMATDLRAHSLLSVCARQWRACVTACLDDAASLSADRLLSIRYEALVSNRHALDRLIDWLNLPDGDRLHAHHRAVVHDRSVGRWHNDLSASEQKTVNALLRPTLERIGAPPASTNKV